MFHVKQPSPLAVPLDDDTALALVRSAPPREITGPMQRIGLEMNARFGSLYTLNGDAMASTADEFIIHESLAHLVAFSHAAPRTALILGGGDGGSARELLKHPDISRVTVAELDATVVSTIRREIPALPAGAFDDPRVRLAIGDAAATLRAARAAGERFDLILFDLVASDDPACAHLHEAPFLRECAAALTPTGLIHVQLGSPFYAPEKVRTLYRRLRDNFAFVTPALIDVPLYGGPWLLARASLIPHGVDADTLCARVAERNPGALRYYNPALHIACAALPNYMRDLLA